MKLCLNDVSKAHYRKEIFLRIEQEFNPIFAFGISKESVKQTPDSAFKTPPIQLKNIDIFAGWSWQKGLLRQLFNGCDTYILNGQTRCINAWIFCVLARIFTKKRLFCWTHGWYGKESKLETFLKKIYFKLHRDGILTYGDRARELMIREGFDGNKIWAIHNSLAYSEQLALRQKIVPDDVYKKHFENADKTLIVIGRLTPRKRLDEIFKAMAILRERGEHFNLVLVGNGEILEDLKTLAGTLGLRERVWFFGACYDETQNAELIFNADLCVVPGDIGLTAIHTMMFGCPCITHNAFPWQGPEFEAIIPGKTGAFFERGNVEALAGTISAWFANSRSREEIRQACYAEIDKNWNPDYQIRVLKKVLLGE